MNILMENSRQVGYSLILILNLFLIFFRNCTINELNHEI